MDKFIFDIFMEVGKSWGLPLATLIAVCVGNNKAQEFLVKKDLDVINNLYESLYEYKKCGLTIFYLMISEKEKFWQHEEFRRVSSIILVNGSKNPSYKLGLTQIIYDSLNKYDYLLINELKDKIDAFVTNFGQFVASQIKKLTDESEITKKEEKFIKDFKDIKKELLFVTKKIKKGKIIDV